MPAEIWVALPCPVFPNLRVPSGSKLADMEELVTLGNKGPGEAESSDK